jgi:glycosyltransferase involved in cell wall biosynthesis
LSDEFVSILMLTHNAPDYVELSIRSVREHTEGVRYELVVVDNASESPTRELVTKLHEEGLIDTLKLMSYNSLFAEGNNVAAGIASPDATHFLLLNSDIEAHSPDWLRRLLDNHERGVISYGVAPDPLRVDGYCLLIDADLYHQFPLDEGHQWWWGVTKQQATLLRAGYTVKGWAEHKAYLTHFGGKSGSAFLGARGMEIPRKEVESWFDGKRAEVIDRKPNGRIPGHETPHFVLVARRGLGRLARKAGLVR